MSQDTLSLSQKKLEDIAAAETARKEREAARNNLESYILEAQDKLWQEQYEAASTQEQREQVRALCSQLDEWIYDEGFDQEASVYKGKLNQLSALFEPIQRRVQETQDRPEATQALKDMLNGSQVFLVRSKEVPAEHQLFTDIELATLEELINETQKWLDEKTELQKSIPAHEDPKLTLSDIADKWSALDREIKYLINKAKIAKVKKEKEAAEEKAREEKKKEEEKKKKKTTGKKKKNETNAKEEEEEEGKGKTAGEEAARAENEKKTEEKEEEEVKKKREEEEDPLNIFEEAREENNSEEDRRKEEEVEEEEEEVIGGEEEEEEEEGKRGPAGSSSGSTEKSGHVEL
ncbi:hypothetical protein O3P69_012016 [Scylla paramamosain]|uniref:Hypoxia up-regulated protein 1 n=1 Tax=Scylla paramamosain TaxID=85552 RepID=A0AAW0SAW8_SCYPA